MKPIPLVLISTGGIFIVAGMNKTDPLSLIKSILTGGTVPRNTSAQPSESGGTPGTSAPFTGNTGEHDSTGGTPTPKSLNTGEHDSSSTPSVNAGINRTLN